MKQILHIGHNDLRLFLRTRAGYVWLFAVPIAFVYFFGAAFRGEGDPANPRPSVLLENNDTGFLSRLVIDELGAQGLRVVTNRSDAARGIRIPAGFTSNIVAKTQAKIEFFTVEGSPDDAAALVELRLLRAVIAVNTRLLESSDQATNVLTEASLGSIAGSSDSVLLNAIFAGRKPTPAGFNQSLPGNLTMFVLMNLLLFGGASISWERTSGVLRRFAVHPLRKYQIVLGKVYGRVLLGIAQIVAFLLLGRFVFNVRLGDNLPGIFLALSLYAWVAASLGVLIGALVSNPEKTVGLCLLVTMVMAALGGCWWPLEIVPEAMQKIGHLFPTAWAMDALHQLITFGGDLRSVAPQLGVLGIYGLGANLVAGKLLKW